MKQVKIDIYNALQNSQEITDIAYDRIFHGYPPTSEPLPCVGFYQVAATSDIADGKIANLNEVYSIDCFALRIEDLENLVIAINNAMNTLPYLITMEGNLDLYENDTLIYHKVLRYRVKS